MFNIGIIGVGSISSAHINAYLNHPEVTIIALCDINQQRLEEKGEAYQVKHLYTNYLELLANPSIDAVSICTWNNTHAEITIAALEAGKHVLVEKPLSMNVEEAIAVENVANQSDKIVQVGFVRRHGVNAQVLKSFIDQGQLGQIYYAKATCLRRLGNPGGWFSEHTKSGGGPLIDLGVHMIDLCWYLMSKPNPVSVVGKTYHKLGNRSNIENLSYYKAADYDPNHNNVEDLASAFIKFDNGASLFVDVSFTLHLKQDELSIKLFGDQGGAELEPRLNIITEKHDTILNIEPQIDHSSFHFPTAFYKEIAHFVECCQTGRKTITPVADGVMIMRILEKIYEAAKSEKEQIF